MTIHQIHPDPEPRPEFDEPIGSFADIDSRHTDRVSLAVEVAVLVLVGFADIIQFEQVSESVFVNLGKTLSYAFAIGAACAATWAMFQAGSIWRKYQAGESHLPYTAVGLLYAAWAVGGLLMATLRWTKQTLLTPDVGVVQQLTPSAAFLALYVLSGALAWHLGHRLSNPRVNALRNAERARERATKRVGASARELDYARTELSRLQGGLERNRERYEAAVATRQAQAGALRALARELIAEQERDPLSTVAITDRG